LLGPPLVQLQQAQGKYCPSNVPDSRSLLATDQQHTGTDLRRAHVTAKKHDASTRFWHLLERYKSLGAKAHDPDWTNPIEVIHRPSLSCTVLPGNPLDDAIAIAFAKTGLNV